jgi:cytochrome P450
MATRTGDDLLDLLSPLALFDPGEWTRRVRSEHGPIVWSPIHRAWLAISHELVGAGFRDHQRLSNERLDAYEARLPTQRAEVLGPSIDLLRGWMVFHDEPRHDALRDPLRRTFTPRTVSDLRADIQYTVDQLIGAISPRLRAGETVDIRNELAFPLPAIVIASLLGVPVADRDKFKTWSAKLAVIVFGSGGDPSHDHIAASGTAEFSEYFAWLIAQRRSEPQQDLISALVALADAEQLLSETELIGACTMLLFAGHETTTNLITNSLHSLIAHPDKLATFAALETPGHVQTATDELHRYDGATRLMARLAMQDLQLGPAEVKAGQTVFLLPWSANRDPAVFDQPDHIDLHRTNAAQHLGFGFGTHFCLGAPLARLESSLALRTAVSEWGTGIILADEHNQPGDVEPLVLSRQRNALRVRQP